MIHLHLDPLGGMAGDMFAACLLAAFPHLEPVVQTATARAAPVRCRLEAHDDGVLTGHRFVVTGPDGAPADAPQGHDHDHDHQHGHGHDHHEHHEHTHSHRPWRDIRAHLQSCGLDPSVRDHAIGIFAVLAEAEGRVHGKPAEAVLFHEVGNADSIADIVAAAVLIDAVGAAGWSVSGLPLGSGRIRTAHGLMPVPAPATTLLLDGFATVEDGIPGERVTPTGAAILAYLKQTGRLAARLPGRLAGTGIGFGTRRLPGTSNCLRLLVLDTAEAAHEADPALATHRTLAVIGFEIDDQSGEDLATGLDRIRAVPGVHDVVQMMAIGKKGRIAIHVQVLGAPDAIDAIVEACFRETTTIGLRTHLVQGRVLPRRTARTEIDGVPVAVKLVLRPDGETGKAESDHLRGLPTHAARSAARRRAEAAALEQAS